MGKPNRLNMKKLILIALIFIGCSAYTQDLIDSSLAQKPGAKLSLNKNFKRAFKKGKYSKIEKFLTKKMNCKKYVIDGYDIFKNDNLDDYNYIFYNVKSDTGYQEIVAYVLEYILNPDIRVNHEVYKKFTVLSQENEEGAYHVVFILNPISYGN